MDGLIVADHIGLIALLELIDNRKDELHVTLGTAQFLLHLLEIILDGFYLRELVGNEIQIILNTLDSRDVFVLLLKEQSGKRETVTFSDNWCERLEHSLCL